MFVSLILTTHYPGKPPVAICPFTYLVNGHRVFFVCNSSMDDVETCHLSAHPLLQRWCCNIDFGAPSPELNTQHRTCTNTVHIPYVVVKRLQTGVRYSTVSLAMFVLCLVFLLFYICVGLLSTSSSGNERDQFFI
jgi:hypothetical protein